MAQKYIKIPNINNINPSMIVLPPASIVDLKKRAIVYLMLVIFVHVVGFRDSYLTGYNILEDNNNNINMKTLAIRPFV
ncbi:MAG TPA: hypothetical protein VFD60_12760 [Nitrososphaeraceae archaeon]|nr:hypothetical protein [Nitrososphaeraceae archaeon]